MFIRLALLLSYATASLILSEFKRLEDGEAIYKHGPLGNDQSHLLGIVTTMGTIQVGLVGYGNDDDDYRLKFTPAPTNAMVAVFTEGQLCHLSEDNEVSPVAVQVWPDSEVFILAHTGPTLALGQIRAALAANPLSSPADFIQLAKTNTDPNWALIHATIKEGPKEWMATQKERCCGGSKQFRRLNQGLAGSVSGGVLTLLAIMLMLYFLVNPQPHPIAYNGCGVLGNGTRVCTAVEALDRQAGYQKLADCFKRYEGNLELFQQVSEWYQWIAHLCDN